MPEHSYTYVSLADQRPVSGNSLVLDGPQNAGALDFVDFTRFFASMGIPPGSRTELHSSFRDPDAVTAIAVLNTRQASTQITSIIAGRITNTSHPKQLEITFLGIDASRAKEEDIKDTLNSIHSQAKQKGCTKIVYSTQAQHAEFMENILQGYAKSEIGTKVVFESEL